MITINIQKKDLYLVGAILIFLVAIGYVIATNSGNPTLHGHTYNEIQPCSDGGILQSILSDPSNPSSPPTWACAYTYGYGHIQPCPNGQILKMSGGTWTCSDASSVSYIIPGSGHDGQSGTTACASIGKGCAGVISNNYVYNDVACDDKGPNGETHCTHVCATWYNDPNLIGVTPGQDVPNVHGCNARVGVFTTYTHPGIVQCMAQFSAVCT